MTDQHDAESTSADIPPDIPAPVQAPATDAPESSPPDAPPVAGAPAEAAESAPGTDDPEARIAALESELAVERDRALRAMADAENTLKRSARECAEARKYGAAGLARDVLEVVDNLERALASMPEGAAAGADDVATLREGVALTLQELNAKFLRHEIHRIAPAPGDPFDPNRHQAVTQIPRPGLPGGVVADVLQAGYRHHDRLLRAAVVATTPKDPVEAANPPAGAPAEAPAPTAVSPAPEGQGQAAVGATAGDTRAGS